MLVFVSPVLPCLFQSLKSFCYNQLATTFPCYGSVFLMDLTQ